MFIIITPLLNATSAPWLVEQPKLATCTSNVPQGICAVSLLVPILISSLPIYIYIYQTFRVHLKFCLFHEDVPISITSCEHSHETKYNSVREFLF